MAGDPPPYGCGLVWPAMSYTPPQVRTVPVNMPISNFGVTVAILDGEGNLTIKVDQPREPKRKTR